MAILNKMTHIRLDREGITSIDNLMILGNNVTNLYLQYVGLINYLYVKLVPNILVDNIIFKSVEN